VPLPRAAVAGLLLLGLLPMCTPAVPDENRVATLTALDGLHGWLQNGSDIGDAAFGFQCLDAWSWFMFSEWHPDAGVRASTAKTVDARLQALHSPPTWTAVTLSYWALALRLMAHRALPIEAHLTQLATVDVNDVLTRASRTTRWWTLALLQQAGASVDAPDPSDTFLAAELAPGNRDRPMALSQVYSLYHEIAPAAALGLAPITGLGPELLEKAHALIVPQMEYAATTGDTDALAEALTTGAILGHRDTDEYRTGLSTLLARQNPDGAFRAARDAQRPELNTDHFRHVVVVATFALLTSLAEYEPATSG